MCDFITTYKHDGYINWKDNAIEIFKLPTVTKSTKKKQEKR